MVPCYMPMQIRIVVLGRRSRVAELELQWGTSELAETLPGSGLTKHPAVPPSSLCCESPPAHPLISMAGLALHFTLSVFRAKSLMVLLT